MSQKHEGCLRKLYPDNVEHKKILDCAKLSHRVLNGYTQGDDAQDANTKKMADALEQGLKTVAPPGTGKSQLLSVPILLALLNHIPILISFATGTAFTTLTIDFANNRARSTTHNDDSYPYSPKSYTNDLYKSVVDHYNNIKYKIAVFDPLEQNNSSQTLDYFNQFYQKLHNNADLSHIQVFAAHSTPRSVIINPSNQNKELKQLLPYFGHLQFVNMEMTHQSLHKLFLPQLVKIYQHQQPQPTVDDNNI